MPQRDDRLVLVVEKPVAGGRMVARPVDGSGPVVLVGGAIPGERVVAEVERVARGACFGAVVEVLDAHPHRRSVEGAWACGGSVYAHVAYPHQLALKAEIVVDALSRIGGLRLAEAPVVVPSPEVGYRMRARLHVRGHRIGFLRAETHELCDPAPTGQLLPGTVSCLERLSVELRHRHLADVLTVELAENVAADERVMHLELGQASSDTLGIVTGLAQAVGLTGLTCAGRSDRRPRVHEGVVHVSDALDVLAVDVPAAWRGRRLRRHVRSFFQGNRYLLGRLVSSVASRVSEPEVWDLYAGVGLFAVGVAVSTGARVTAVEHDPFCAADLTANAAPFGETLTVVRSTVERFLRSSKRRAAGCLIVDPPRVGLTRDAVAGILRCRVPLMIYVSCDPPTFARDVKRLLDGGYRLDSLEAFDLFPNTAHVEIVASLRLTSATEPRNP